MSNAVLARAEVDIAITLRSPFLMQGLKSPLLGVDVTQIRDQLGRPVIPADQVHGLLRDGARLLQAEAKDVLARKAYERLFGPEIENADDAQGKPAKTKADRLWSLACTDLVAATLGAADSGETTRIEIDDVTGAAQTGHLVVVELVAPFGKTVEFNGGATIIAPMGEFGDGLVPALDTAIKLIASVGAMKTVGFGEVVAASVTLRKGPDALSLPAAPANASHPTPRYVRVTFDRPLLVDAEWVADNAFEGAEVIPGGVFKGALAQRLRRGGEAPETSDALSRLRISHAFPEASGGHLGGLYLPLSLVGVEAASGAAVGDALDVPDGKGAIIDGSAPLFVPDWKPSLFEAADEKLGRPEYDPPARITRTHTAIDTTGTARDQMLFSTIARSNLDIEGKTRSWLLRIDAAAVGNAGEADRLVAVLGQGLDGIGKTNARAEFHFDEPAPAPGNAPAVRHVHGRPDHFALVLLTPAILVDPLSVTSVAEQYAAYFAAVCAGAHVVSFYASQRMAGRYAAMRHLPYPAYYPFVLTSPGSVFLLRDTKGAGSLERRLRELLESGLPVPSSMTNAKPLDWKNCPFVPENGFGAFTADYLAEEATAALLQQVTHA